MKTLRRFAAAAIVAATSLGGQALAQPPAAPPPSTATPPVSLATAPPATRANAPDGTDTSATAGGGGILMTGLSVRDNTGALIGEVTGLKNGVATITMGADTFSVGSDRLYVWGGVANIAASRADLRKLPRPKGL